MNRVVQLFSIFILGILFSYCNRLDTEKYRSKKNDSMATKEMAYKVSIEYTDSGELKAKINTPEMIGIKNIREPYVEMPKGIAVHFLEKDSVVSYLTAEYGISFTNKKHVIVRRNVRVLNIKGEKLETEELHWDQKTQKIRTDKFVTITTEGQIIRGEGLIGTFTNWEIQNVTGTTNIKNELHDTIPHIGSR